MGGEPKVGDQRAQGEQTVTGIEPIDFAAAYEVVTERIRRAIHIGSYVPGDKLPPERMLAQQASVGWLASPSFCGTLSSSGRLDRRVPAKTPARA